MKNALFWNLVKNFNFLMQTAIEGPDCTNLEVCKGDCCSIKIDVPKVLAEEYIMRGYAVKSDFIRGDVFSFKLRFDEKTGKCFLFNKSINGCLVHESGIKPPQCWIYPTNFSNNGKDNVECKRASGWKIIDSERTILAERILKKYVFLCQLEAKKELKKIKTRLDKSISENYNKRSNNIIRKIKKIAPSQLGGFLDTWDRIEILSADGISLQMKKFCSKYNKHCKFLLNNEFLECNSICSIIAIKLIEFLEINLYSFIKKNRLDNNGEYPLYKLFEFNINL